ncbi:hypothetical protein EVAR_61494_1 [Eumeta japonica]|uniref:Uncharacterized protein n=1 Tax=Eumeta variegata TaxID=151549 RepID=A0A4C2A163_EUMVA|nr:hypothetical protein EVAR_61494_1 [Eumeta japonica]
MFAEEGAAILFFAPSVIRRDNNLRYKIQGTESHSVAEEIGGYVVADNLGNYDKAIRACSSPWAVHHHRCLSFSQI